MVGLNAKRSGYVQVAFVMLLLGPCDCEVNLITPTLATLTHIEVPKI